jgi:hypothetical protein
VKGCCGTHGASESTRREEREANKPKHERKGNGRTIQLQCLFVFVKGFISSSFFWPYMLLEQFQELAYILGS